MVISLDGLYSMQNFWLGEGITVWKNELSQDSCVINEFGSYIEINMYKVAVISLMQCKKI